MKQAMLKTTTGTKIWNQMEAIKTVINIKFHDSRNENDPFYGLSSIDGITMPTAEYNKLIKEGKTMPFTDKFTFDQNKGDYVKTKIWDQTTVMIDEGAIEDGVNTLQVQYKRFLGIDLTKEHAIEILLAITGTHEGTHTGQKRQDFWKKVINKITGKYIDHQKKGKADMKDNEYNEEREKAHEAEAYGNGGKVREEFEKQDAKKQKSTKKDSTN